MSRPVIDVVVPFAGSAAELDSLLGRLERVELPDGDQILVANNRPASAAPTSTRDGRVRVVGASGVRSSYHARNRAAAAGNAPWLLFVDADVQWSADVLDAYFDPPPSDEAAVLAGAIEDAPLGGGATLAERYAVVTRSMSDQNTLDAPGRPPYAQTANCLVRRAAFEAVGGFVDDVRSGGDADLCFRLREAGWELERRPRARVVHRNRRAVRALLRQKARHGSGAAWLDRRYSGTFPRRGVKALIVLSTRQLAACSPRSAAVEDRAVMLVDVAAAWAFELGRLVPNQARGSGV